MSRLYTGIEDLLGTCCDWLPENYHKNSQACRIRHSLLKIQKNDSMPEYYLVISVSYMEIDVTAPNRRPVDTTDLPDRCATGKIECALKNEPAGRPLSDRLDCGAVPGLN
jgi:hypothetical protein